MPGNKQYKIGMDKFSYLVTADNRFLMIILPKLYKTKSSALNKNS